MRLFVFSFGFRFGFGFFSVGNWLLKIVILSEKEIKKDFEPADENVLSAAFSIHVKAKLLRTLKKTDFKNVVKFHNPNQNFA